MSWSVLKLADTFCAAFGGTKTSIVFCKQWIIIVVPFSITRLFSSSDSLRGACFSSPRRLTHGRKPVMAITGDAWPIGSCYFGLHPTLSFSAWRRQNCRTTYCRPTQHLHC